MTILWTILIGLVVGLVAKLLMPGRDPGGFIVTTLLGIGGSLLASFLGRAMGWYPASGAAAFVASVLGAILLLVIYRLLRHTPRTPASHMP
jgi:uncharacterized membrane protein YeaQ/YmgE (transglycosylase-associated protein family)